MQQFKNHPEASDLHAARQSGNLSGDRWLSRALGLWFGMALCLCFGTFHAAGQSSDRAADAGRLATGSTKPAEAVDEEAAAEGEADEEKGPQRLEVPIPVGHVIRGLRLPNIDPFAVKHHEFTAKSAKRIDKDHVEFTDMIIFFFNLETGEADARISSPLAELNLETHLLTSEDSVTIERSDFTLTGETMEFDTWTRTGKLTGNIHMIIYEVEPMGRSGEPE